MTAFDQVMPEVTRPDAGTALLSEWIVGTPERQRLAVEALLGEWRDLSARFRPSEFLRLSCFGSTDGEAVLSYSQWTSDAAHLEFARRHRDDMVGRIDAAIPGIQRPGLGRYRLRHSAIARNGVPESNPDGAIAVVRAQSPNPRSLAEWVKATEVRLAEEVPVGAYAAHLLVTTDDTRAMVYLPLADGSDADLKAFGFADGVVEEVVVEAPRGYVLLGSVAGAGDSA